MTAAWAVRSAMVVLAAVSGYLLAQTEITLEPVARIVLGGIIVALAAINPQTIADKVPTRTTT